MSKPSMMVELNDHGKREYLRARGWSTWYHENYWVHAKTVTDPKQQDCTNYGMRLADAYEYERRGLGPFPIRGFCLPGSGAYSTLNPTAAPPLSAPFADGWRDASEGPSSLISRNAQLESSPAAVSGDTETEQEGVQ